MAIGKVKWFNNAKGYGFVLPEDGGEDLFAHFSAIQMEGYKTLKAGQDVLYDVVPGPKGMHAVNIRPAAAVSAVEPEMKERQRDEAQAEHRNGDDSDEPSRNGSTRRDSGYPESGHRIAAAAGSHSIE